MSNPAGKKSDTLYDLVWRPMQPFLKGIKKVAISPAGLLNRIAFSALPSGNYKYLLDEYQIRQYGSSGEIAEQKNNNDRPKSGNNAVLYGGILFDQTDTKNTSKNLIAVTSSSLPYEVKRSISGRKWGPLPGTLKEVRDINKLLLDSHFSTKVITSSDATEESLKQLSGHSPQILHLATHGFFLPDVAGKPGNLRNENGQLTFADNPLFRSGIIMAGANRVWCGGLAIEGKDDGILTAYEISNIDLSNTDLVVLSACETALGDIKGTEGVFGLQRAFKFAGVKEMLLSLWDIPDKQTSELMELFYANKLKGMPSYQALNFAQQIMRKKYAPYYWAAFELIE
ncbi:MAG: CHAT domain-containing protein [Sphingobacteriales bacterium]